MAKYEVTVDGQQYEVERREVYSWHTKVFLVDFSGKGFPLMAFVDDGDDDA